MRARRIHTDEIDVDAATAVIALAYYLDTNPGMVAMAKRKLVELFGPEVLIRR